MTRANLLVKLAYSDKDYLKGWKMFLLNRKCFSQLFKKRFGKIAICHCISQFKPRLNIAALKSFVYDLYSRFILLTDK